MTIFRYIQDLVYMPLDFCDLDLEGEGKRYSPAEHIVIFFVERLCTGNLEDGVKMIIAND